MKLNDALPRIQVDAETYIVTADGVDPAINKNTDPTTNTDIPVGFPADFQLSGVDKGPGHEFENVVTQLCGGGLGPFRSDQVIAIPVKDGAADGPQALDVTVAVDAVVTVDVFCARP